jgi:hypothetical protein
MLKIVLILFRAKIGAVRIQSFQKSPNSPVGYLPQIGLRYVILLDAIQDLAVDAQVSIRLLGGGIVLAQQSSDDNVRDQEARNRDQYSTDAGGHP